MKLSKKIVSLLTVTALVTSLTACGSSSEKSGSESSDKKTYRDLKKLSLTNSVKVMLNLMNRMHRANLQTVLLSVTVLLQTV